MHLQVPTPYQLVLALSFGWRPAVCLVDPLLSGIDAETRCCTTVLVLHVSVSVRSLMSLAGRLVMIR